MLNRREILTTLSTSSETDTTAEDTPVTGNVLDGASTTFGTLSVLDFRVGGQIYLPGSSVSIDSRGTFTLAADGTYTFTPLPNYAGSVPPITVLVTNGRDIKALPLTLTVTDANDAPVANDDARITLVNTPITIDVLANDQDADDDALTVTHLNGSPVQLNVPVDVGDGTVTFQGGGTFLADPDTDFTGSFSFTYTISDGTLSDTGTVTILVGVTNDPMFSAASPIAGTIGTAAYNFGLTYMGRVGNAWNNGVNVTSPPYSANQGLFDLTNREPWLYDRASTVYALYRRTQDPTILAAAIALADQYMAGVEVVSPNLGRFNIVGGDPGAFGGDIKYLYPIIGVWYERETASSVHRAKSLALYNQSLLSFSKTYNPAGAALWTERNAGYAIQNCTSAYWLHRSAGNLNAANTALQDAWDYFTMVEGMSAASGAPLHGHNQHEGSAITTPVTSPWMAAFLAESLVQLYRTDPDQRILDWLSAYGDFLIDNAFYITDGSEHAPLAGLRLPAYLVANTQTPTTFREGELLDMEHAMDVSGLIKKVIWAKTILAENVTAFNTLLGELEQAAEAVFLYWTRNTEGYPRYRVAPPRKYGWWFRNAYSDTSLFYSDQVPTSPLSITTVSITGSTQSGSLLTATPGTWDASPAAVLTYQWYRGATPIGGATNSTYTTQVADEGTTVTVRETATNAAGAVTLASNGLAIVPAGAPEITVQPSNATAEVGQTAQFSAECDASPAATYQWQVSTDGGQNWANVAEGTGGSGSGNTTTYTTEVLAADDDGDRYRCVFTNANGSATTAEVALLMVIDQGSARFVGNAEGAQLIADIGGLGHTDFVIEMLCYFEGRSSNAAFFGVRHVGNGRTILLRCTNTFDTYFIGIGDSQTGQTPFPDQPPLNTWLHMTVQSPATAGGTLRVTWTVAEGAAGTRYVQTRTNGIEASVQAQSTFVGGLAVGNGDETGFRCQYVRGRTGYLADAVVDGHRQDTDTSAWNYWWRFYDDGGNLAVEDKTGNNLVPTITGGTFATGPVVPGVP